MRTVIDWDNWFMEICRTAAKRSKDDSTQVGACIVKDNRILAVGYNGFPVGVKETEERWTRPLKYTYVVHAEANCLMSAARYGVPVDGATLYSTLQPCANCAKHIAQAGIVRVIYDASVPPRDEHEHWIAEQILKESGVLVVSMLPNSSS
jgi:dCMP deaminase